MYDGKICNETECSKNATGHKIITSPTIDVTIYKCGTHIAKDIFVNNKENA